MIITNVLRYFKVASSSSLLILLPLIWIVLFWRQFGTRAHTQPPPAQLPPLFAFGSSSYSVDPYAGMMNQIATISLRQSKVIVKIVANQEDLRTHLLMFVHHNIIIKLVWIIPLLGMSGLSPCLLVTLVLFLLRVLPSSPRSCLLSLLACIARSSMGLMICFTPTRISSQMSRISKLFHPLPFRSW